MKRLLQAVLAVVVAAVVLVVCLPWLISTDMVRTRVVASVDERIPGSLSVTSWSLSWLGASALDGILYQDVQGNQLRISGIRMEKGLLALLRNRHDFGRIDIIQPMVALGLPEPRQLPVEGPSSVPHAPKNGQEITSTPQPADSGPATPMPFPDYLGVLAVRGGSIAVAQADGTTLSALRDLNADLVLNGSGAPLTYQLSFGSAEEPGKLTIKGDASLGTGPTLVLEDVALQAVVSFEELDLGPLATLAGMAELPQPAGMLTGDLSISGGLAAGLGIIGRLEIVDMTLSGGPLQGDKPALGDVAIDIEGSFAQERILIKSLLVDAKMANFSATGTLGSDADGEFTAEADINLAEVLSQLPNTLGVQEGMTLEEGSLRIVGSVRQQGATAQVEGSAVIDRLRGIREGQPLAWDTPVTFAMQGVTGKEVQRLDHLQILAPFLTIRGKGDLQRMDVQVEADLSAALAELRKFVKLATWDAGGKLNLGLHVEPGGEQGRAVVGTLSILGGSLSRDGSMLVPPGKIQIDLSSRLHLPEAGVKVAATDTRLSWQAWLGEGTVAVDHFALAAASGQEKSPLPTIQGVQSSASLDLARVSDLLHRLDLLDEELQLAGASTVQVKAAFAAGRLDLSDAKVDLVDLAVSQGDKTFREAALRIGTAGWVEPATATLHLPAIDMTFSPGTLQVRDLNVQSGEGAEPSLQARLTGDLDLEQLIKVMGGFAALPEGVAVAGKSRLALIVDGTDDGQARVEMKLEIDGLQLTGEQFPPLAEEKIVLTAIVRRDPLTGAVAVDNLKLVSVPVSLSGRGNFAPGKEHNDLHADGAMALDLEALSHYLRSVLEIDLVMQGREERPFSLQSSWNGTPGQNVIARTEMSAGLSADLIETFGMRMESLVVPLQLTGGVARVDLSAGVNGGQLTLRPVIDYLQPSPKLVLEDPANILVDVQLTEALAEQLLARIHPLFKGASAISGTMDLHMDQFDWPLDAAQRDEAVFNGVMQFRDLTLSSAGLLGTVLALAKISDKEMAIGDRQIEFACVNGRVTSSPIRITVDGNEIELSGTIGLDQTLDYAALIPVTEKLVGNDAYRYLQGTTIRLPIRGTLSKPDLGSELFSSALDDLTRQALQNAAKKAIEEKAGKLLQGLFK